MPYPVENLIEGRGQPTTARPHESAQRALARMLESSYSQLPVIDEANRPLGMITHESILCALSSFDLKLGELRVSDAIVKAHTHRPEDDLFELLDRLKETNAVLIVDGENKLLGIVTSYDSTEYFRQRAEDLMWVEDIEGIVKALILVPFTDQNGEVDGEALERAIEDITTSVFISRSGLLKAYKRALQSYLQNWNGEVQLDPKCVEDNFFLLAPKPRPKPFDRLVLSEYTELLLHESRWPLYEPFFNQDPVALRTLLDGVRNTRNLLAHFRGEPSPLERTQLRFGAEWLGRHSDQHLAEYLVSIPAGWPVPVATRTQDQVPVRETAEAYTASAEDDEGIAPTEEPIGPATSRYAPLANWLQSVTERKIRVSFDDVEAIIGAELPDSARRHRSWWANDAVGHPHARQWLDAGWRVSTLNMTTEEVEFFRTKARERAYIDFFTELKRAFVEVAPFEVRPLFPTGKSWHTVYGLPLEGLQSAILAFSFAARHRFRVELYIDSGERDRNKAAFDLLLAQKEEIEAVAEEPLEWERIDDQRASRIALYRDGAITDDEEKLEEIRNWALDAMSRFYRAVGTKADSALRSVGS